MSLLRSTKSKSIERPSLIVKLKIISKKDRTIDEQETWQALVDCFKNHPELDVFQAEIIPDYDA